jgi:hypothetical protein
VSDHTEHTITERLRGRRKEFREKEAYREREEEMEGF